MVLPVARTAPMVRRMAVRRPAFWLSALVVGLALPVAASALLGGSAARPASPAAAAPARSGLGAAPVALQAAASSAFGAESSRFSVVARKGSLVSAGGGLSTVFGATGPVVRVAGSKLRLSLAGVGYGTNVSHIGSSAPVAAGNQVSYGHAGVTEWYRNGPAGLEQGFTLAHQPAGSSAQGWLTVAIKASGPLIPAQQGSQVVFAGKSGGAILARYGGLTAVDAAGLSLPSRLVLHKGTMLLQVDDAGARYPLTIDPVLQPGTKLNGAGEVGSGSVGSSVAISSDGTTAVVGGASDNAGVGAVWVFTQSGGVWTQQGSKLTGTGETGAGGFGTSVALSADGTTALVGGPTDSSGVGATWVFTQSGGGWTQQGSKLLGAGEGNTNGGGRFGAAVALSSDGNTALIGGSRDFGSVSNTGAAWVFTRSGSTWTQQGAKFTGTGGTAAFLLFGGSVALSADGNTALIGGAADGNGPGAAWVFTRSGVTWTQQGSKLVPVIEGGSSHAGASVALSSDGNTALVGGYGDGGSTGAAWVYTRSGTTWTQGMTLYPNDETGSGLFGSSVALSSDGDIAVVGGPQDSTGVGGAWMFQRYDDNTWFEQGSKVTPSDLTGNASFGSSVALSGDGSTSLIGGPNDNGGAGAAWAAPMLNAPDAPTAVTAVAGDGQATVSFTAAAGTVTSYTAVASDGSASATGASSPLTVTGLTDGTTYTFYVFASNAAGGSDPGESNEVTPTAPEAAETAPVVTTPAATAASDDSMSGTPGAGGTVTSPSGTTVTWPIGTFSVPVTVTTSAPSGLAASFAVGTSAIQLVVTNAAGVRITEFSSPIELVFLSPPAGAMPGYSRDGITWTSIPKLAGTTLPAGYPDGWFRDSAGNIHLLTLHATDFGTLAAGSKVTAALQLGAVVHRTLNLSDGHKLAIHLDPTLPGSGTFTLRFKGKVVATLKPVLTGKAQVVSLTIPKAARHVGIETLTLAMRAGSATATEAIEVALVAHR